MVKISTGLHLTVVFRGGIPIGSITEVVGRGKTHLAQQLTVQAAMEVVLFIDAEKKLVCNV